MSAHEKVYHHEHDKGGGTTLYCHSTCTTAPYCVCVVCLRRTTEAQLNFLGLGKSFYRSGKEPYMEASVKIDGNEVRRYI